MTPFEMRKSTRNLEEGYKETKGLKDGHCNRSACQASLFGKPQSWMRDHETFTDYRLYYCEPCTRLFNEFDDKYAVGHRRCTMEPPPPSEIPRYRCHKEVWALKIAKIQYGIDQHDNRSNAIITPAEEGYAPFVVSEAYVQKHNPEVGGYFVVYHGDGYQSYSPAKAFEEGYTRI